MRRNLLSMGTDQEVQTFFDTYAQALLDRDEKAVARLYAVPALILFPGHSVAVSEAAQTEAFFGAAWQQYEGVEVATPSIHVLTQTDHSVWADVTWYHDGQPQERFVYQLVRDGADWRIAVLTPIN